MNGLTFAKSDEVKYPLTIKDSQGRTVIIKREPARIVSIAPSTTELLYALGLGPKVVAVSSWCDYPPEVKKKEKVGSFSEPNVEKIVSLAPDVVFGAAGASAAALEQLGQLGIPSAIIDSRTIEGVFGCIRDMARITNRVAAGNALCASLEKRMGKVVSKIATLPKKNRPKVFYELWNDPLMSAGSGTFINDLIKLAGGMNIAGDAGTEWPAYSLEVLINKNPDIIIYAHGMDSVDKIRDRKGWANIKAVKTGRIILLPDENIVLRPGPRIIQGLEAIAKALHPELFK
jgi:iron complex transport system substrate-binding protein